MHSLRSLFRAAAVVAVCTALVAMVLMLVGTFTEEWTCREAGSDWACVGPNCNAEADKRFNAHGRTMSCERSDWPMVLLTKLGATILPRSNAQ